MSVTLPLTLRASSALATPTTEYGTSYETAKVTSTATSTSANKLVDTAGNFVVNNVAVGDIIKNTTTGKFALVTAVDSATQLSVSADNFSSTNTYVLYSGTGYKLQQKFTELIVVADLTAAATDATDTLDIYIDTSFDGGATFVNIGHFTQMLGNGGAKKFIMSFKSNPIAAANCVAFGTDQAASAALQIGFGDRIRYRTVAVDASTQNASFTYSLKAFFK